MGAAILLAPEEMIREPTQPDAGSDVEGSSGASTSMSSDSDEGENLFRATPTSRRRLQRSSGEVVPGFSKRTYGVKPAYESNSVVEEYMRSKCSNLDEQLDEQLDALRALLPVHSARDGKERNDPSVVMDAYRYIMKLQQEVEDLNAEVLECLDSRDHHERAIISPHDTSKMSEVQQQPLKQPLVEVMKRDGIIEVRIVCANRPMLLVDVMEAVESRGLTGTHSRIVCGRSNTTTSNYLSSLKNEEVSATILLTVEEAELSDSDSELDSVKALLVDAICEAGIH